MFFSFIQSDQDTPGYTQQQTDTLIYANEKETPRQPCRGKQTGDRYQLLVPTEVPPVNGMVTLLVRLSMYLPLERS
ncbi:MAG TPA: hypothetical protein ENG90_04350 [Gammaproteobacteria bacterium]|nr:hypothetical protein [Gammaproteobacteria bacterium]HDZ78821.1 hypothetical protein [Gammaproteobacteria bacterium]